MSGVLKIRGGTTAQHATFTGQEREITVDTTKDTLVVHDGTTAGGFPLAKRDELTATNTSYNNTTSGLAATQVQAAIDEVVDKLASTIPAGAVVYVAQNTAPTGFLKANGAAVSRTTYAALFAAIGTTFGAGNGTTTFTLPDLRGEFLRGWDDGRGVDSGRAFGSAQADDFKSHVHMQNAGVKRIGGGTVAGGSAIGLGDVDTNATGGTETRPRNIALLACIKF